MSTNKKAFNSGVAGTSKYGIGVTGQGGKYGGYFVGGVYATGKITADTVSAGSGLDAYSPGWGPFPSYASGSGAVRAYANTESTQGGNGGNLFDGVGCNATPDYPIPSCGDVATIDGLGNAAFAGSVYSNGSIIQSTKSSASADVASFGARVAAPSIEDVGKALLRSGLAYVALDKTFASTIDHAVPYSVFVTPEGDSNGLYTTALGPRGFVVRESKGGHASLTFDYRIVAKPLDAAATHLPAMSAFSHHLRRAMSPVPRR